MKISNFIALCISFAAGKREYRIRQRSLKEVKVKRDGLMYQPAGGMNILQRSTKFLKRNGKVKTGEVDNIKVLTQADKDVLVASANLRRAAVKPRPANMKYVTWDESLASSAAEHARRCQFGHSTADQLRHSKWGYTIGENIAVFRGPKTFETDHFVWVTDGFYDERKYYNYETGHCEAQCGHYEVLVHAEQEKMGCAVSSCTSVVDAFMKLSRVELGENPFHVVVCHYAPVVMTPSLYEKGGFCGKCPRGWNGGCIAGLCTSESEPAPAPPARLIAGIRTDSGLTDHDFDRSVFEWSEWSSCTRTCGIGIKWRFRMCEGCQGPEGEMQQCRVALCPASSSSSSTAVASKPKFLSWSNWSACDKTCGSGRRIRNRKCSKPWGCSGVSAEAESCWAGMCNSWGAWGSWNQCNVKCGSGTQTRTRICVGGNSCAGPRSETKICDRPCSTSAPAGFLARGLATLNGNCAFDMKRRELECKASNLEHIPPFERDFASRQGKQQRIKLMKNLNFEGNAIEDLGHLNGYCKFAKGKIDTINLAKNKLKSLRAADFSSCRQIRELNISENPLSSLDIAAFKNIRKLSKLVVSKDLSSCWGIQDVADLMMLSNRLGMQLEVV
ncbi:Oidioi.mRNA.OKI2018_I69.chr2.g5177.t1.cds [Oikopleura dioica]|uniref:Oidioi.mRNA.OKI2018_I69.chr2.g5166.t1.cds n=1 Tax=Oikopleura dioica TaxID=34765 RepID=A0ABN7T581_OIKDI|nr:Oidioi.mRNA.OKI2018_I69.chr2.g5166.t1.cds [Oikopleura dioica]CAG5110819.1 Oidioi.mRNA.OKI2018_I69.chr2.g5177.t1.cds [Oikopleura dioica]